MVTTRIEELAGRAAVVTGAGSGIGEAFARLGAERGLKVLAMDISQERLSGLLEWAREGHHDVRTALADVSDYAAVEQAAETIRDWGPPAVVINNAGVEFTGRVWETDPRAWERVQAINVNGAFNVTRAFLPAMIDDGRPGHVVMLSSVGGLSTGGGMSGYICSKFSVRVLAQCLREELEAEGAPIRVTSVHPGPVRTNIFHDAASAGSAGEQMRDQMRQHLDSDGVDPSEVARLTFEAMEEGRFWVHTHPAMSLSSVERQYVELRDGIEVAPV